VILAELRGRSLTAVAAALEAAGASVHAVADVAAGRRCAAVLGTSAVVVIETTPGGSSMSEGLAALSRQDAVLLVVASATAVQRTHLLRNGADHVLDTPDPEEVVAALAAVLRRAGLQPVVKAPELLSSGPLSVHMATRTATCDGRVLSLTALEFDLLAYLVSHAGDALSRERLLADVWGYSIGGLETVTVHVRRLRKKIEADPSRPALLQTVWGVGYRLVDHSCADDEQAALPSP
jgi:DNA-binding response OmpR family regulator